MLQIGSVLDGKYEIQREVGHGGMSVVYQAVNVRANKIWAVKEVRKDGGNDNEVVSQGLIAETEMLKKLNHPHLPSIIDVIDTDDSFIIVMDYIEGRNLQYLLDHKGAQDPELIIGWAKQLCDVLGYLHSRKPPIIYRDMKPANVMLKPDGQVMLIDFGTAREFKVHSQRDTTWLGTRGYAAPEQFGGHGQTDARTDIYNLGATMYHLLTGYSPADTQYVIKLPGELRPELKGTGIEKIVAKCCQPEPKDRYQNCAELMYALNHVHEGEDEPIRKRNRRWYSFWACVAVALIGAFGMIGFRVAETGASNGSYSTYISQAQNSSNLTDKVRYYKKAIDLKPGTAEAYSDMLSDFFSDGEISSDEKSGIETCLNSTSSARTGNNSNLVFFQTHNVKDYAQFEYTLGQDYYKGYAGGKTDAYNAFGSALDSGGLDLDSKFVNVAASLQKLTEYDVKFSSASSGRSWADGDTGGGITYRDFWDELADYVMNPDTIVDKSGGDGIAAAVCRETARQITTNYEKLKAAGVAFKDMQVSMENADTYLSRFFSVKPYSETTYTGSDDENKNVIINAAQAVDAAQNHLTELDSSYALQHSRSEDNVGTSAAE